SSVGRGVEIWCLRRDLAVHGQISTRRPDLTGVRASGSRPRRTTEGPADSDVGRALRCFTWLVRDSNPRRRSRLIYSQIPLAARATSRERCRAYPPEAPR